VPADARGRWLARVPEHGGDWRFEVSQRYQMLEIEMSAGGRPLVVRGTRLRGEEIRIAASGLVGGRAWNHLFQGKLSGPRIEGQLTVSDGENKRTLPWTARRE
jgi:hypothetical protein